ncbi:hypothetical protein Z947_3344 [Sulfitobacter geojensis]|nr:hypothetical protein Z947_3344 [Sulfitobacter geojensis]
MEEARQYSVVRQVRVQLGRDVALEQIISPADFPTHDKGAP